MSNTQCFPVHIVLMIFYTVYYQCFIDSFSQAWHLFLFRQDDLW